MSNKYKTIRKCQQMCGILSARGKLHFFTEESIQVRRNKGIQVRTIFFWQANGVGKIDPLLRYQSYIFDIS